MAPVDRSVTLDDKYTSTEGDVFLTGLQALVLVTLLQGRRDRAQGLKTGGFISGYRGSPLSGLDQEFQRAEKFLAPFNIRFQGGVNENLAATAVWGSQNVSLDAEAACDGVFGMWFGKGAGLDQCVDVMRHANNAGTARHGGVLAVVGDDHALKSSSQPHHCEPTFADLRMPVLYPSSIQEILEYGLLGYALSRDAGVWVGFKTLPETVNSAAVVHLPSIDAPIAVAAEAADAANRHVQWPDPWPAGERRFYDLKLPRILEFLRLNRVNRVVVQSSAPVLGIVTTGKSYVDTLEALRLLGLTLGDAERLGVSLYKIGAPWPLEPVGMLDFIRRNPRILVVEEKRPTIEDQIKTLLFGKPVASMVPVVGRMDDEGQPLLSTIGELAPEEIARAIARQLPAMDPWIDVRTRAEALVDVAAAQAAIKAPVARSPFFCSGCPHNSSTRVPEGSKAMAGIGCHGMAMWAPDGRTSTHTHMGGEGVTWIGHAGFTKMPHIFQNLGEGTYHHSGSLAIRAAVSAKVNITYKILFNDAVAMTGGQAIDGVLSVPQLANQLKAEGVQRLAIVTDDPAKYKSVRDLPAGTTIDHRDDLDRVQRTLREIPGVTVLIYDQVCATEKRRRRKRGRMAESETRAFINDAVCEGCGDCSAKSNCLSVVPVETEFGRKRRIDQSACNTDLSCLKGFCPSFVTVEGGKVRKGDADAVKRLLAKIPALPMPVVPEIAAGQAYSILCAGIGGTGVVTVGAILGMAARLCGRWSSVHDRLGMAQKFGAVTSHIRIAGSESDLGGPRIPVAQADMVLGCDPIVTGQADVIKTIGRGRTRVVLNSAESVTSAFVSTPDFNFETAALIANITRAAGGTGVETFDAARLANRLVGDSIGTNMLMLGYAFQRGLVPLPLDAIHRAIELNGTAVEATRNTFALGRLAAHDSAAVTKAIAPLLLDHERLQPAADLETMVAQRKAVITDYQDAALAERYLALVERVRRREQAIAPGRDDLAKAVAKYYFKLLTYKDEYEVARLYASPDFRRKLKAEFGGDFKLGFHLAPPIFSRRNPVTGEPKKMRFGGWILPVFGLLARLKGLRGTAFDIFGYSEERKQERALIADYEALVDEILSKLHDRNRTIAVQLLSVPEQIRGFGPVKLRHMAAAAKLRDGLLRRFRESD